MNTNIRKALGLAASACLAAGVVACGDDEKTSTSTSSSSGSGSGGGSLSGKLAGAGASSQDAAQQAWIAGFQQANEGVTISYDPVGSGGGREQFNAGGTAFGGTDSAYNDDEGELSAAQKRCGGPDNFVEIPVYISPIALIYNVDGVDDLKLSPDVIAKIFHGDITQWDDAAIKDENPDAKLPGERITVVHRSDDSGTTHNFTDYMAQTAPSTWTDEPDDAWPVKGQEAAEGTSGVVDAVENGSNTIGYADASQAGDLGQVAVEVGSEGVKPSPEGAAAVVEQSKTDKNPGKYMTTYTIARKTKDPSTYPIVLVSYEMACTKYDNADDAALVKGYLSYVISPEGQDAAAKNAGSAPISDSIRTKITPAVEAIGS
jgi:phosphate transport system substrate-binding protein